MLYENYLRAFCISWHVSRICVCLGTSIEYFDENKLKIGIFTVIYDKKTFCLRACGLLSLAIDMHTLSIASYDRFFRIHGPYINIIDDR